MSVFLFASGVLLLATEPAELVLDQSQPVPAIEQDMDWDDRAGLIFPDTDWSSTRLRRVGPISRPQEDWRSLGHCVDEDGSIFDVQRALMRGGIAIERLAIVTDNVDPDEYIGETEKNLRACPRGR